MSPPPDLTELGRSLVADPADAALTARWTRTVVDALPEHEVTVIDHLASLLGRVPGSKIEAVVVHQLALGRDRIARHLLSRLARAPRSSPVVLLQHNIALHLGATELAERLGREVAERGFVGDQVATSMAARRALAGFRPEQAVAILGEVPPDDVLHTNLLLTALRGIGRHDRLLEVLDATDIPVTPTHTAYRYDALLAVGDLDAAGKLAASLGVDDLRTAAMFDIRRHDAERGTDGGSDGGTDGGSDEARGRLVADVGDLEARDGATAAVLYAYLELGLLDEVERLASGIESGRDPATLDPTSTVHLARLHYLRGRFDQAMRLLDTLTGFDDRWDAETYRLRVMIETGRSAEAIERQWPRTGTVHTQLDDAIYHALLREHRLTDAFRIASPWRQKQVTALFGTQAGNGEDPPHVRRRFVLAQSGLQQSGLPQELVAAGAYRELATHSDELVVTCDPRLESVLTRSLPGITFLPVPRLGPRAASYLGPGRTERAGNSQFEELTAEALEQASASEEVVLARLLQHRALVKRRKPARRYLVPDPQRAAEWASRLPAGPRVGVVWRGEALPPRRDLHNLAVDDLAPLFAVDATFVSLQYDATDDERAALRRLTDGRIWFPDEADAAADLRDDVEAQLALSSELSAVVGVGAVGPELAAAGGVPTILLATNHLIAWRATDGAGRDFWHGSARLALTEDLQDREQVVLAAAVILRQLLRRRGSVLTRSLRRASPDAARR